MPLPVTVAQQPLIVFAGRQARRLGPRNRCNGDISGAPNAAGDQFLGDLRSGEDARRELGPRPSLLAEVFVRHAEPRDVGDFRVRDHQVLAFLWIDIHAAGNERKRNSPSST